MNGKQGHAKLLFAERPGQPGASGARGPLAPARGSSKRDSPLLSWNMGTGPGPGGGSPDTPAFWLMGVAVTSRRCPQGVFRT